MLVKAAERIGVLGVTDLAGRLDRYVRVFGERQQLGLEAIGKSPPVCGSRTNQELRTKIFAHFYTGHPLTIVQEVFSPLDHLITRGRGRLVRDAPEALCWRGQATDRCDRCSGAKVVEPCGGRCSASAYLGAQPEILSRHWICRGPSMARTPAVSANRNRQIDLPFEGVVSTGSRTPAGAGTSLARDPRSACGSDVQSGDHPLCA
jgi:hypothetical protein